MMLYYATTYYAVRTSATARILFLEGTGSSLLDEANKGSQSRAFIFCHFKDLKFGPRSNRVPICDPSRVIAGTAGHPSFRKSRCEGQIMPICESSRSVAIARSCFCRRFPRSELSKGSLPYTTSHVSAFFVHDESISRKKGLGAQEQNPASPRRPSRPSTRTPG